MRNITALSALLIGALVLPAHAASADDGAGVGPVNYRTTTTSTSTIINTDAGTMTAHDGVFTINAADGTVLAGTELSFRVDDFLFPITAEIADRTATLSPRFDLQNARYAPVALPFEDQAPFKTPYDREVAAWNRLASTIGMGASIGILVGGIGGGAVGCVLGGIAGATVAAATIVGLFGPLLPASAIGCLGGILAVGALGTIGGQLLVAAPVAILAAIQYFTTIGSPFQGK
ncbi:hypothetical protein GFY24_28375 [Nocardia sp. SYP-A9097]|uniref:hypothetical protein n=1 Tax=Nocardia sp. SYP-A9097 TaxID=2663237 RepID=UPI00129C00FF|nr:hypothetical protein [Nocardia sp. SYP-A9097]MRH91314.1 hypothetical protein [Nocardia sp. SYP-A9097]